jgi:hypothetical protein
VESVRLVGASIVGKWTVKEKRWYRGKDITVAQRFSNSDNRPETIPTFVERFGPVALTQGIGEFSVSVAEWLQSQQEFQKFWRVLAKGGTPSNWPNPRLGNGRPKLNPMARV